MLLFQEFSKEATSTLTSNISNHKHDVSKFIHILKISYRYIISSQIKFEKEGAQALQSVEAIKGSRRVSNIYELGFHNLTIVKITRICLIEQNPLILEP